MSLHDTPGYNYTAVEKSRPYDPSSVAALNDAPASIIAPATWTPSYLRRRTFICFFATFAAFIAAIQTLLAISNRQQGLATSTPNLHYLWTFGPTAILTLTGALWARVEYQAKSTAPWYRMTSGPAEARHTLLLDYLSMLQPVSVFKALRNQDYAVAAITTVSLLIKVVIVFSTGLINLSPTEVPHSSVPIRLLSKFTNNTANLRSGSELSSYMMGGMIELNFTLPDGVASQFVFPEIASDLPLTTEFQTTVDAFSADLQCEPAAINITLDSRKLPFSITIGTPATISIDLSTISDSPACQVNLTVLQPSTCQDQPANFTGNRVALFLYGGCGGSTDPEDQRIALIYGTFSNENGFVKVQNTTQELCIPKYNISTASVTKNGTQILSATLSNNTNTGATQLDGIHPWDIMQALSTSYKDLLGSDNPDLTYQTPDLCLVTDPYTQAAIGLRNRTMEVEPRLLAASFDDGFLSSMWRDYWQQSAAIVAHGSLMEPTSNTSTTAFAVTIEDRLIVQPLAAHVMTGLLAVSMLLLLVDVYGLPAARGLPFHPSTLVGTAALLADSQPLLLSLSGLGSADPNALANIVGLSSYYITDGAVVALHTIPENDDLEIGQADVRVDYPIMLHPLTRAASCLVIAGLIAGLEVTLQASQRNSGLGDVDEVSNIHYLWTTIPALVFTLVSLELDAVDFQVRSLAPYTKLRLGRLYDSSVGLDLLDRTIPSVLVKEIQTRNPAALFHTLALAIASFFTIISASLFHTESFLVSYPIQLQTVGSFASATQDCIFSGQGLNLGKSNIHTGRVADVASLLILAENLTYPTFTYENLAFPEFQMSPSVVGEQSNNQNVSNLNIMVNVTVPALRPRYACRLYDSTQINATVTAGGNSTDTNRMDISLGVDACLPGLPSDSGNAIAWGRMDVADSLTDFDFGTDSAEAVSTEVINGSTWLSPCSAKLWIWGHVSTLPGTGIHVPAVSALSCNGSFQAVDVATTFFGTSFHIDPSFPPVPIEHTARPSPADLPNPDPFQPGLSTSDDSVLAPTDHRASPFVGTPFFTTLLTSRYAVPAAALGDPSRAPAVADAITFLDGVMRVQDETWNCRVPADATNATLADAPPDVRDGTNARAYNGTATGPAGRLRLVQDAASTRALEALLGAALLFSALGWLLMPNTRLLPRDPTSIASAAALLADSDMFRFLPQGRELERLGVDGLAGVFPPGTVFRMGWAKVDLGLRAAEDRFTITTIPPGEAGGDMNLRRRRRMWK